MPNCRGCGAEIVWAKTASNNKAIPLDPKAEIRAVQVGTDDDLRTPIVQIKGTFMPHHATCPKAKDFRTKSAVTTSGATK